MVIRKEQKQCEDREHMRGGEGSVRMEKFAPEKGLPPHFRLLAELVLQSGCSIGAHVHEGECEVFYVLSGKPEYLDNGSTVQLYPGDVAVCYDGENHSIMNRENSEARVLAFIVTNA